MRGQHYLVLAIMLVGCARPSENTTVLTQSSPVLHQKESSIVKLTDNSHEGLPRFKLVAVYEGELVSLGPQGQIVVQPTNPKTGFFTFPTPNSFEWLTPKPVDDELRLIAGGQDVVSPAGTYVDSSGAVQCFIEDQPIQIDENGTKVGIVPMRTQTPNSRYYLGKHAIYGRGAKEATIRWLLPLEGRIVNFVTQGDNLIVLQNLSDHIARVTKIGLNSKPEILAQGSVGDLSEVAHVDSSNRLTVRQPLGGIAYVDRKGNFKPMPNGMQDLNFFKYKDFDFFVGFVGVFTPGQTIENVTPVIWNKDQKPVTFAALLGEDGSKIDGIWQVNRGRILSNAEGYVAIGMFGYSQHGTKSILRTYLLKAVD